MTVVQNVGNRNVEKQQIHDFDGQNEGNGNVQKLQINDCCTKCRKQKCPKRTDK